MFQRR